MTRHEFLKALHELLRPKFYLEIGVQHGWSLQLSRAEKTIGIDPNPLPDAYQVTKNWGAGSCIAQMTSDEFFVKTTNEESGGIDLAFIDGMHLIENVWRDFINVEVRSHTKTVVVLDDVLPTTQEMAARDICPGDWTGDVWKIYFALRDRRPDLTLLLVDTEPTGVLVAMNLTRTFASEFEISMMDELKWCDTPPPDYVLDRRHALAPSTALAEITRRLV